MTKVSKYDVIIMGSGIGGLTAGMLLSKEKKVLLLEKEANFGGYCTSFSRGDFNFEVAIEAINGLNNGQVIHDIFRQSGILENASFTKTPTLYRSIYPDYDLTFPQSNIEGYKKILYSFFKKEKKGIDNLINEMKLIYDEIDALDKKRRLLKSPSIMKSYHLTFGRLLNEFINDDKLKSILSQYWLYCGLPPSLVSSLTFSYIWYDYTVNGSFYPKSGMGHFSNECVNVIIKNSGDVYNNAEICKIYNRENRITEIEVVDGRRFTAECFISNIDPRKTFDMLSEKNESIDTFVNKLQTRETSISAYKIYLGLDVNLAKQSITDGEIFINPNYDLDKMYLSSVENEADNTPMSVVIYSNLSRIFCTTDKSIVSITILSGYDFWKKLDKNAYFATKEKISNILIKRAEIVIPNLRKYIKQKLIATPLTMERYTGNSRGAIYGWSKGNLYDEIRFMKATTPIKNLFLSSHWTKIGGGVAGVVRVAERAYRSVNRILKS